MEDAVRLLLRPSETLSLALEARDPHAEDARAHRVLALVAHVDAAGEQGWCVVLLPYTAPG
jgi:hypothetical protein